MPLSGIYAADVQVFRFYPDGTVLDVLVKPPPGSEYGEAIAGWLRRENPPRGVYVSTYALKGHAVSFTSRSHFRDGPVQVQGTWANHRLTLDIRDGGSYQKQVLFTRIWPPERR
jgi:hypothetical protein